MSGLLLAMAVAAAPPDPVSNADLVEITDLSSLALSPDGRMIAFRSEQAVIGTNDYRLRWYVAPVDRSRPARPIGDGGGALFSDAGPVEPDAPVWAPSGRALYVRALIGGEIQVWRLAVDRSGGTRITQAPANIRSIGLTADGRVLRARFGATREQRERAEQEAADDGVIIDGHVDPAMPLVRGSTVDGRPASTRFTGFWFARAPLLADTPEQSIEVGLAPADLGPRPTDSPGFGPPSIERIDGKRTLTVRLPDGRKFRCLSPACIEEHVETATPYDAQSLLVMTSDIVQRQRLALWFPATGRWRTLVRSRGALDGGRDGHGTPCATGGGAIVCVAAEPDGPPRLVSVDPRNGTVHTLFDPNESLRSRTLPVRLIRWKTPSGITFGGQLLLPPGPRPTAGYPLVINYYACEGFLRGGLGNEQPMLPLAAAGIASLCIEMPHLPPGQEGAAAERSVAVAGVSAAIDLLAAQHLVDRTRVGMVGLSFGSEMTMAVLQQTGLLRAAEIASGQREPGYYWMNTLPGRTFASLLEQEYHLGDPDTDRQHWDLDSPARHVDRIRAPLLLQLPENEMRVSMELISKLSRSTTPSEIVAYANETHVKHQPRHQLAVYRRTLDWFRFWLLGEEDPDPAKADQYRRWRAASARWTEGAAKQNGTSP